MAQSIITSKGQVTIPKKVREELHLQRGDKVDFILKDDGCAILQPMAESVKDVFGMLAREGGKSFSIDEINAQLKKAIKRKYK